MTEKVIAGQNMYKYSINTYAGQYIDMKISEDPEFIGFFDNLEEAKKSIEINSHPVGWYEVYIIRLLTEDTSDDNWQRFPKTYKLVDCMGYEKT